MMTAADVQSALPSWRVLLNKVHTVFKTGDFVTGAEFISRLTPLAEAADHHPDVDLRYPLVHISLYSHDVGRLTERDVNLARQISELATEMGIESAPYAPLTTEIAIDAMDIPAVKPFWGAILAYQTGAGPQYRQSEGVDLIDPAGLGPNVWFQQMDQPRSQRNRIHIDVHVPHDQAGKRVTAAIEAGGRLVNDDHAPSFWVLADPEGNEACVCTFS